MQDAVSVTQVLERNVPSGCNVFILGDTSYGRLVHSFSLCLPSSATTAFVTFATIRPKWAFAYASAHTNQEFMLMVIQFIKLRQYMYERICNIWHFFAVLFKGYWLGIMFVLSLLQIMGWSINPSLFKKSLYMNGSVCLLSHFVKLQLDSHEKNYYSLRVLGLYSLLLYTETSISSGAVLAPCAGLYTCLVNIEDCQEKCNTSA